MKPDKLTEMINSLTGDIDFEYDGKHGAICPFSRTDISLSYGDEAHDHTSIADVMNDKIFNGKCLNEISEHKKCMLCPKYGSKTRLKLRKDEVRAE